MKKKNNTHFKILLKIFIVISFLIISFFVFFKIINRGINLNTLPYKLERVGKGELGILENVDGTQGYFSFGDYTGNGNDEVFRALNYGEHYADIPPQISGSDENSFILQLNFPQDHKRIQFNLFDINNDGDVELITGYRFGSDSISLKILDFQGFSLMSKPIAYNEKNEENWNYFNFKIFDTLTINKEDRIPSLLIGYSPYLTYFPRGIIAYSWEDDSVLWEYKTAQIIDTCFVYNRNDSNYILISGYCCANGASIVYNDRDTVYDICSYLALLDSKGERIFHKISRDGYFYRLCTCNDSFVYLINLLYWTGADSGYSNIQLINLRNGEVIKEISLDDELKFFDFTTVGDTLLEIFNKQLIVHTIENFKGDTIYLPLCFEKIRNIGDLNNDGKDELATITDSMFLIINSKGEILAGLELITPNIKCNILNYNGNKYITQSHKDEINPKITVLEYYSFKPNNGRIFYYLKNFSLFIIIPIVLILLIYLSYRGLKRSIRNRIIYHGIIDGSRNSFILVFNREGDLIAAPKFISSNIKKRKWNIYIDSYASINLPLQSIDLKEDVLREILKHKRDFNEVFQFIDTNSNEKRYEIEVQYIGKKKDYSLLFITDVTQLLEKEKMKGWLSISKIIAHDVKTPIAMIRAAIEAIVLPEIKDNELAVTAITDIEEELKKVDDKIQFLLRFSSYESENREFFDPVEILDEVINFYNKTMKGLKIVKNYSKEKLNIKGIKIPLMIAFQNIISNSVEAMHGKGEIKFQVTKENNKIIISIEDTGGGLKEEIKDKLFKGYTTKEKGYGRGLKDTKDILKQFNAELIVENMTQKGFLVKMVFPV